MSLTNLTFQIEIFVFITVRTSNLTGREIMIGLNWMLIGSKVANFFNTLMNFHVP
jgi:hypothetical protein